MTDKTLIVIIATLLLVVLLSSNINADIEYQSIYPIKNPIQTYVSNVNKALNKFQIPNQQPQQQPQLQQQQQQQQQPLSPSVISRNNPFSSIIRNEDQTSSSTTRSLSPAVAAAVQSKRFVELVSYANQYEAAQPQVVEVDAITAPVQFVFRSASGPLMFQQIHVPSMRQEPQHTRSEEPAQLLTHEVYKPIIQELREVIQPYRHVTQEIKPVLEEVRTIVAHGDNKLANMMDGGSSEMGSQEINLNLQQQVNNSSLVNLQSLPSNIQGVKTIQKVKESSSIDFAKA